jgi:hypothetical protein
LHLLNITGSGPAGTAESAGLVHGHQHITILPDAQFHLAVVHNLPLWDIGPGTLDVATLNAAMEYVGPVRIVGCAFTIPMKGVSNLTQVVGSAVITIPGTGKIGQDDNRGEQNQGQQNSYFSQHFRFLLNSKYRDSAAIIVSPGGDQTSDSPSLYLTDGVILVYCS